MTSGIPPIPLHALLNAQWTDDCLQGRIIQGPDTSGLLDASQRKQTCAYRYCGIYTWYFSLKEGLKDVLTDGSN